MIDGVRVHRVKWVEFKPARFVFSPFSLARILFKLKRDVDLVHVHNISWFGAFVTLFAKALGLPVITKLPNIGDFGIPGIRRGPFGFLRIALLKGSDAIIAHDAGKRGGVDRHRLSNGAGAEGDEWNLLASADSPGPRALNRRR